MGWIIHIIIVWPYQCCLDIKNKCCAPVMLDT